MCGDRTHRAGRAAGRFNMDQPKANTFFMCATLGSAGASHSYSYRQII